MAFDNPRVVDRGVCTSSIDLASWIKNSKHPSYEKTPLLVRNDMNQFLAWSFSQLTALSQHHKQWNIKLKTLTKRRTKRKANRTHNKIRRSKPISFPEHPLSNHEKQPPIEKKPNNILGVPKTSSRFLASDKTH